jgi:uncharacterized membrane protein
MISGQTTIVADDEPIAVRKIALSDLWYALEKGYRDFEAIPSHGLFLCVVYPAVGLLLIRLLQDLPLVPLLYPLASGFALIGPIAAVGLYSLSRRRELGLDVVPKHALEVFHSPALGGVAGLAGVLLLIFISWLLAAQAIYDYTLGIPAPTFREFMDAILSSEEGWSLIVFGNGVGLLFAILTFAISVVSFPLVLDRNVGAFRAIVVSIRAVAANPLVMAVWAMIVGGSLLIASLPFFVGLIVAVPVLGHASWHLYRRTVQPA